MPRRSPAASSLVAIPAERGGGPGVERAMAEDRAESGIGTGRAVACVHCRAPMRVAAKAQSATCPKCYKRQTVEDVVIDTDRTGSRVETTGILFIKRKGRVWAPGVRAGDAVEVLGELKADVVTHGHVVIGESARWRGDCTARLLIVEDGARIDGGFFRIGPAGEPVAQPPAAAGTGESIEPVAEPKPLPSADALSALAVTPQEPPSWSGAAI